MSLLRALPSLRSRAVHRTWAASLSSSASTSASTSTGGHPVTDIFDALASTPEPSPASTSSIQGFAQQLDSAEQQEAEQEDGPPLPSEDSYPPSVNPVAAGNAAAKIGARKPVYAVSVKATRNNTIVTFARPKEAKGAQLVTLTGGKLGFKKSNRNGYEAGYQCAVGIIGAMEKELERTDYEWELFLKGFGQGRDAMLTAITTAVGEKVKPRLVRVTDRTPIKIGGTRSQKARRI